MISEGLFVPPDNARDLALVRSSQGHGLYASAGSRYGVALYGRDMAESAEDLLHCTLAVPDTERISQEVIVTLTRYQGTKDVPPGPHCNEEQVGKIHHEHRSVVVDGRGVSAEAAEICRRLAQTWGKGGDEVTYYGSIDATFLYVRLVALHCQRYGASILGVELTNKDGVAMTVKDGVRCALRFALSAIDSSDIGLVEFRRRNPRGIEHQTWTDSATSYLLANGWIANHHQPIASVEIQGLAYDALIEGARLLDGDGDVRADDVRAWRQAAGELQERALRLLWMPGRDYFAEGIDRDPTTGCTRHIDTITSKPGVLLDTAIFDTLAADEREKYIRGIVSTLYSSRFMTTVGVRCRSVEHAGIVDFVDYHGERVTWAKETNDISRGLRRQGFPELSRQLDARMINATRVAGRNWEFFMVMTDGRVDLDPRAERPERVPGRRERVDGESVPDEPQAWTVTAMFEGEDRLRGGTQAPESHAWQQTFEESLLGAMPMIRVLNTPTELRDAYYEWGDDFLVDSTQIIEQERRLRRERYITPATVDEEDQLNAGYDAHA